MTKALTITAVVLTLAGCSSRSTSEPPPEFRRIEAGKYCMALTVYARPDAESMIGTLITQKRVSGVPAVNVSVIVDGGVRGAWRRESEVLQWYVRADDDAYRACTWDASGDVQPGRQEVGLDERLWLLRGGGWTRDQNRARATDLSF